MRITNLKPLISEEAIQTRVKEMAGEIDLQDHRILWMQ